MRRRDQLASGFGWLHAEKRRRKYRNCKHSNTHPQKLKHLPVSQLR
jgi:hypothetical protein